MIIKPTTLIPYTEVKELSYKILQALRKLRISSIDYEYDLQNKIAEILKSSKISYEKEFKLGPRNRVDFFINGIVIEVKKGKPICIIFNFKGYLPVSIFLFFFGVVLNVIYQHTKKL